MCHGYPSLRRGGDRYAEDRAVEEFSFSFRKRITGTALDSQAVARRSESGNRLLFVQRIVKRTATLSCGERRC